MYYVKYTVLDKTYYAGPYTLSSIGEHKRDIEGYDGISNVSIEKAAPFYKLKDPLGFCSNFWKSKMFVDGRWFETLEHLYQAQKTKIPEEFNAIWKAETPKKARDLGQKVSLVSNWDDIKYNVMKQCLMIKFTQHHDLLRQLLETGNKILVENCPASTPDLYWAWNEENGGLNKLGIALMEVRDALSAYWDR